MHRCLGIVEILGQITEYLTPREALQFALTCRIFSDPGLDEVWHTIRSFEPLIACLPQDVWREQKMIVPSSWPEEDDEEYTIMHLVRPLKREHIARYLDLYAPRIRQVRFDPWYGTRTPSIESLHGLQVLTGCQPGVLSPLLKRFDWYEVEAAMGAYGWDYATQLAAHMSLFLGKKIEQMSVDVMGDTPLSFQAATHSSMDRCKTNLRKLYILGKDAIGRTFQSITFQALEDLELRFVPPTAINDLAALPMLRRLDISSIEAEDSKGLPLNLIVANPNTFSALHSLEVKATQPHNVHYLLRHLPPNRGLHSLEWDAIWEKNSVEDWQLFLKALATHYKCFCLTHLKLRGRPPTSPLRPFEPPVEIDPLQLGLEPLFKFGSLQTLEIEMPHCIALSPSIIAKIPSVWPALHRLILAPSTPSPHPPDIDHTHVLELCQKIPSLTWLSVRFDASRITGEERPVGPPPKLRLLGVGRSPILSPSGVTSWILHNFPEFRLLITERDYDEEDGDVFKTRWEAVDKGWREARKQVSMCR